MVRQGSTRRAVLVVVLSVVGVIVAGSLFWPIRHWYGGFELTVDVSAPGERPKWIWLGQRREKERAEGLLAGMLHVDRKDMIDASESVIVDPFDGQPHSLHVALSGRDTPIFGALEETQHGRFLIVIAEMPDGRRVG